ncbi:hypothetical protein [Pontibaca salina]|uniref:Uncharacterized protein n=1 Tax=Pontibaca salina TaxID=2795731 RepID=A0A934M022_9RHOB|nr:hypothetical protein [Pontibaca salina]MBI6629575.1 hypothetical protein [Pontibaca salina]
MRFDSNGYGLQQQRRSVALKAIGEVIDTHFHVWLNEFVAVLEQSILERID